ncbi:hypothetical protein FHG87_019700 [Trinorchestia longiramus]|nr:hypothetical protein FHG87_019700 [Trinorchestia longiramus]
MPPQIGPSCQYGMLVYSLQPSFIRRSHSCSQDHLDVVYNEERVSRYCGPLSRQQRVSGAQIWSTSSPKNLTLLFESSPTRRRGNYEQNNWGVAIDVAGENVEVSFTFEDLPNRIMDSESDVDLNGWNASTDSMNDSTATDTIVEDSTHAASSDATETSTSSSFSSFASEVTSTEAISRHEFDHMVNISSQLSAHLNVIKGNETSKKQSEEAEIMKTNIIEPENAAMVINDILKNLENNALVSEEDEQEDTPNNVLREYDTNRKLHKKQILNEISGQNQDTTGAPMRGNNVISKIVPDKNTTKNFAANHELDRKHNVTEIKTAVEITPTSRKDGLTESMNRRKTNDAIEKRGNRKDPDRFLRGTVQATDSAWEPSQSSLYQSHRFRKFPW